MSREHRRTESMPTRVALLEADQDRTDQRLGTLEEAKGANRTAFISAVATIIVAVLGATGLIASVVLK